MSQQFQQNINAIAELIENKYLAEKVKKSAARNKAESVLTQLVKGHFEYVTDVLKQRQSGVDFISVHNLNTNAEIPQASFVITGNKKQSSLTFEYVPSTEKMSLKKVLPDSTPIQADYDLTVINPDLVQKEIIELLATTFHLEKTT